MRLIEPIQRLILKASSTFKKTIAFLNRVSIRDKDILDRISTIDEAKYLAIARYNKDLP